MKLKTSIKFTDNNLTFLRRLSNNEAFANDSSKKPMTLSKSLDLIEKYFKMNNDRYKEMIAMGGEK